MAKKYLQAGRVGNYPGPDMGRGGGYFGADQFQGGPPAAGRGGGRGGSRGGIAAPGKHAEMEKGVASGAPAWNGGRGGGREPGTSMPERMPRPSPGGQRGGKVPNSAQPLPKEQGAGADKKLAGKREAKVDIAASPTKPRISSPPSVARKSEPRSVSKYLVRLAHFPFTSKERDFTHVHSRYPRLHVAQDFRKVVSCWQESVVLHGDIPIENSASFYYGTKKDSDQLRRVCEAEKKGVASARKYNAKVQFPKS